MEEILERILSHPLLTVTLSLFCLLLIFAILKRLLKMALVSLVFIAIYFGYVHYFQADYPLPEVDMTGVEEIRDGIQNWITEDLNVTNLLEVNGSRIPE